jgi:hypothetical protein
MSVSRRAIEIRHKLPARERKVSYSQLSFQATIGRVSGVPPIEIVAELVAQNICPHVVVCTKFHKCDKTTIEIMPLEMKRPVSVSF